MSQRTALTTLKGRVFANGWAVQQPDGVRLLLAADMVEPVADFLRKYLAFSKSKARILSGGEVETMLLAEPLADLPVAERPLEPQLFEARLPLVTAAISDQFLPQMLGLTDLGAVDFSKGCYLGQEIVARAEHRGTVKRRLFAFAGTAAVTQHDASAPVPGDPVTGGEAQRQMGTVVLVDAQSAGDGRLLAVVAADAVATESGQTPTLTAGSWMLSPLD